MKKTLAILPALAIALIAGCYGSQVQCSVHVRLFSWDPRPVSEILADDATNFTARANSSAGIGSNARVTSDTIQSMVLHKSPVTASSNTTDTAISLPLIK
jgi:hypothetical protein